MIAVIKDKEKTTFAFKQGGQILWTNDPKDITFPEKCNTSPVPQPENFKVKFLKPLDFVRKYLV